jgi:hypothetical protein
MIQKLKKLMPDWLKKHYIKLKNVIKNKKNFTRTIFTDIYLNNSWNGSESVSGPGSSLKQTETLRKELEILLLKYEISSILDIPCGDFHWMQYVEIDNIRYIGADIVKPLIFSNREKYGQNKYRKFLVKNIIKDVLPDSNLIVCRDCFVHLSFDEILKSLNNIKRTQCIYLLTTTFTNHNLNIDSSRGGWRRLNLEKEPFNFPPPISLIIENCTEGDCECSDKSMGLWLISDL